MMVETRDDVIALGNDSKYNFSRRKGRVRTRYRQNARVDRSRDTRRGIVEIVSRMRERSGEELLGDRDRSR
jgi:hypothetical protein